MKLSISTNSAQIETFVADVLKDTGNLATVVRMASMLIERKAKSNARAKGGRKLWLEIADAIHMNLQGGSSLIVAEHKLAYFKEKGGTIYPKRGKYLAVPQTESAQKFWPRNFPGKLHREGSALKTADGDTLYVLIARAVIPENPWWPTDAEMQACASQAVKVFSQKNGGL